MQSTTQPLRVGVVGLGWAGETHIKAYLRQPNVTVEAVAGLEPERRQALGATYNIPRLYEHWEDLVKDDALDIVSVCAPNYLHAPIGIAALRNGKHVLCEKPLARTGEEATAMVETAKAANRVLMTAFNRRYRGDMQVLKQYIDAGKLGRVYYAKASWMRRSGIPGMGGWFTQRDLAGGGPLIDLGVHVLDMGLYLLGEPEVLSVNAATYAEFGLRGLGGRFDALPSSTAAPIDVEDLATAFLRLEGGATLLLEASWATHSSAADDFGVTLYGTEGGAEIRVKNYSWEDTLRIYTNVAGVPAEVTPQLTRGEEHVGVVRSFVDAIREGNWTEHTGVDGMQRARVIDACYASALQGREVVIEDMITDSTTTPAADAVHVGDQSPQAGSGNGVDVKM